MGSWASHITPSRSMSHVPPVSVRSPIGSCSQTAPSPEAGATPRRLQSRRRSEAETACASGVRWTRTTTSTRRPHALHPRRRPPSPGWFNVAPHLPEPLQPPLHPGTRQPVGPDDLAPLFPMALIGQEVSAEPWIDIPGEVLDVLRSWRPTPLVRARRLEAALQTPAPHLLQGRVGLPGRIAQAEHGGTPGVLQQGGGHRRVWPPRPAPGSGAARWPSPRPSSGSSARCTWCAPHSTRSRTAG